LVLQITNKRFNFSTSNPFYCCSLFHCFLLPYLWFCKFWCPESVVVMFAFLRAYVRAPNTTLRNAKQYTFDRQTLHVGMPKYGLR